MNLLFLVFLPLTPPHGRNILHTSDFPGLKPYFDSARMKCFAREQFGNDSASEESNLLMFFLYDKNIQSVINVFSVLSSKMAGIDFCHG